MTQAEVVKLLEKHKGKKFTSKEIAAKLKVERNSIATNLKRLKNHGAIRYAQINGGLAYVYWIN